MSAPIRISQRLQKNNLVLDLKLLGKKEDAKPQIRISKKIIKVKRETNGKESTK
jgi:hypothetical protein